MSELTLVKGENVKICDTAKLDKRGTLILGNNVYIAHNAYIQTHYHPIKDYVNWREKPPVLTTLKIEDNVYIGYGAIILPQVEAIGEGAIVGAMAVVTKDVKAWTIVAGSPAKVIGKREPKDK
jgi:acetyltransferase-like isoleucine patch superfamily enzyme